MILYKHGDLLPLAHFPQGPQRGAGLHARGMLGVWSYRVYTVIDCVEAIRNPLEKLPLSSYLVPTCCNIEEVHVYLWKAFDCLDLFKRPVYCIAYGNQTGDRY